VPSLTGRSVVVTRPRDQVLDLIAALENAGATIVQAPTIEITPAADAGAALAAALADPHGYEWIVYTSANAVHAVERAAGSSVGVRVAVVGPATARAVHRGVDLMPPVHTAAALAASFPAGTGKVLIPQSSIADPALARAIRAKGWQVTAVTAYDTISAPIDDRTLRAIVLADAVVFASPSAVHGYAHADLPAPHRSLCIGPRTAAAAAELEWPHIATAAVHTVSGLVALAISELGH
jgi:uroporphyrinogen-III synthase